MAVGRPPGRRSRARSGAGWLRSALSASWCGRRPGPGARRTPGCAPTRPDLRHAFSPPVTAWGPGRRAGARPGAGDPASARRTRWSARSPTPWERPGAAGAWARWARWTRWRWRGWCDAVGVGGPVGRLGRCGRRGSLGRFGTGEASVPPSPRRRLGCPSSRGVPGGPRTPRALPVSRTSWVSSASWVSQGPPARRESGSPQGPRRGTRPVRAARSGRARRLRPARARRAVRALRSAEGCRANPFRGPPCHRHSAARRRPRGCRGPCPARGPRSCAGAVDGGTAASVASADPSVTSDPSDPSFMSDAAVTLDSSVTPFASEIPSTFAPFFWFIRSAARLADLALARVVGRPGRHGRRRGPPAGVPPLRGDRGPSWR